VQHSQVSQQDGHGLPKAPRGPIVLQHYITTSNTVGAQAAGVVQGIGEGGQTSSLRDEVCRFTNDSHNGRGSSKRRAVVLENTMTIIMQTCFMACSMYLGMLCSKTHAANYTKVHMLCSNLIATVGKHLPGPLIRPAQINNINNQHALS
jgi:hypothetical protein